MSDALINDLCDRVLSSASYVGLEYLGLPASSKKLVGQIAGQWLQRHRSHSGETACPYSLQILWYSALKIQICNQQLSQHLSCCPYPSLIWMVFMWWVQIHIDSYLQVSLYVSLNICWLCLGFFDYWNRLQDYHRGKSLPPWLPWPNTSMFFSQDVPFHKTYTVAISCEAQVSRALTILPF